MGYLVTSRDAVHWDLSSVYRGEPLIERGGSGAWDKDQIYAMPSIITWHGKHWIFYMGVNERHDCDSALKTKAIGVATVPEGRLTYAEPSGSGPGHLVTWPLVVPSSGSLLVRLKLDVAIPTQGSLWVDVLSATDDVNTGSPLLETLKFTGPLEGPEVDCE